MDGLIDKGALLPGQVAAIAGDSRFSGRPQPFGADALPDLQRLPRAVLRPLLRHVVVGLTAPAP
uniref:Uncharacterized protein n=1 Tax=Nonomuraea gerenzanensis TaxID=93944 RepID=A0A1M4EMG7_9ACTN|nr:hypothetical protein BN4615_P9562 [Nonomuraea gerenzanensis]